MPIHTALFPSPTRTISLALLLIAAACGGDGTDAAAIQAGTGATAAGMSGSPMTPTAGSSTGTSGTGAQTVGAAGTAGKAGSGGAGASAAGSSAAGSNAAGSNAAGSSAAGSTATAGTSAAGSSAVASSGGEAAAGSGGTAGAAGAAGMVSENRVKPKCKTSPKQVIVIGDSYINWITHTFPDDLAKEAGETWRMYAIGGYSLGSGGLGLIPDQLDQAIKEDPNIVASVMSGGGNDILIADEVMFPGGTECKDRQDAPMVKACQDIVATAITAGEKLMKTAGDAGIRDVIYMFYPHIPGGGFGGMNPNFLLDYALPKAKALCDDAEKRTEGKLRCHFIDLVPVFEGQPDWFADDGIHENSMGSAAIAKEVVKVAKDKCVAQPASSGCCEP